MNPLKGELEYGSISLDDKEDYRLYRYSDAGMGETEYRIFRNGAFFAMFDNRKDAEEVMTVMTHKSERDKVLERATKLQKDIEASFNKKTGEYNPQSICLVQRYVKELQQAGSP